MLLVCFAWVTPCCYHSAEAALVFTCQWCPCPLRKSCGISLNAPCPLVLLPELGWGFVLQGCVACSLGWSFKY